MNEVDIIDNNFDLMRIQEKHSVNKERFVRGVIFAEEIVNGTNATSAYSMAFEVSKYEAQTRSSNFRNNKWVQELILYFKPDDETLHFGEIRQIIRVGMAIVDDAYAEPKDRIAAMNALSKYIKVGKTSKTEDEIVDGVAAGIVGKLMDGIGELVKRDKMVNEKGEIIDVPILK